MPSPLRIDPEQRFTCSQCGRCCRRWEVFVSDAERQAYARRGVARWFRETDSETEGTERDLSAEARRAKVDPFEAVPGWRGVHRIRSRADGACGFLSPQNRCRLHEELGAAHKPLTCRMFPFTFHQAPASVVVTASFGCPTIVENRGELIAAGAARRAIESTYKDHLEAAFPVRRSAKREGGRRPVATVATQRLLVVGRSIDARSIHVLRESLLRMLSQADGGTIDLRANLRRIAHALDDLTRRRVLRLADTDFAEYIKLTLPHAAGAATLAPPKRPSGGGRIGRLMQFGFLYAVVAARYGIEHRGQSRFAKRLAQLRLLLHFHGLAPGVGRVNVRALTRQHVDLNAPEIQPVAYHYLRASLEAIGARQRPILDDVAIAVSCLNAAGAIAVMNAHAAGTAIDRALFSEALMESVDLLQADGSVLLNWALPRLASGVEALRVLAR